MLLLFIFCVNVLISLQSSQTDSTFLESSQLTIRAYTDPAIVLSMFMLSFIFVTECGLFEWKRICRGFSIIVTLNIFYCQAITGYTDNGSDTSYKLMRSSPCIICLYMYCRRRSSYQEGKIGHLHGA